MPRCSRAPPALIAVLDACLVTGFNIKTLTSLSVSGGVATGVVALGHGFTDQAVVLIAGATPGGLDGECRITVTSATQFTFPTTAPDGAATSTVQLPGGALVRATGLDVAVGSRCLIQGGTILRGVPALMDVEVDV